MNALITGGAGFVGSHLVEALLRRDQFVTVIDDLSTGSVENVRQFRQDPRVHCIFESMMSRSLLSELVDEADAIYHLAAAVGVRRIIESPVRTIETNIKGTEMVLECAAKKGKPVFVASTSEVYGKNSRTPFREDDDIVMGPSSRSRWSYATSKLLDEFLALAYYNEKKVPVVIGRLFNTVGPRQTGRYGMVLPTFVRQASKDTNHDLWRRPPKSVLRTREGCCGGHNQVDGLRAVRGTGGEHRKYGRDHDVGVGEGGEATNGQRIAHPVCFLRRSLRTRLRRYDEASSLGREVAVAHRLSPYHSLGRHY